MAKLSLGVRKCEICKEPGVIDDMIKTPVKNRAGEIQMLKSGEVKYKFYHQACWDKRQFEILGWNNLYDYILREYFTKELPSLLIMKLKEYRQNYTFQQMKSCLEEIELDIKKIQYKDCQHLSNLLIWMLKNHMEDYVKKQNQRITEAKEAIEFKFLKVNNSNIKESENIEDYDILD